MVVSHSLDASPVGDTAFELYVRSYFASLAVSPAARLQITWLGQPVQLQLVAPADSEGRGTTRSSSIDYETQTLYMISTNTKLHLEDGRGAQQLQQPTPELAAGSTRQASLFGYEAQTQEVMQIISKAVLTPPAEAASAGVKPTKGILLFGPSGTGKSVMLKEIAAWASAQGIYVTRLEAQATLQYLAGDVSSITHVFENAAAHAPSIVIMDDAHVICPSRDGQVSDAQRRVVAALLGAIDGPVALDRVCIVAASNRPQGVDKALRRPGRLDVELEVGIPTEVQRTAILRGVLRSFLQLPESQSEENALSAKYSWYSEMGAVSKQCHGYVGSDLLLLCKEAIAAAAQRSQLVSTVAHSDDSADPAEALAASLEQLTLDGSRTGSWTEVVRTQDFLDALPRVRPSAIRELTVEVPKVRWLDIGGMDEVKQSLREVVEWPLQHPEVFERFGIRPPTGVLLYGPPGCSKTLMAKALATESSMNFLAVKGPELLSKWLGESEKAVQELFRRARAVAPSVIFFDEIDALAGSRSLDGSGGGGSRVTERVLSQLLTEIDGIETSGPNRLVVLAATNRPDLLDPALLRPGRMDRKVYVSPPDLESRKQIFMNRLKNLPCASDVDFDRLAELTDRFSGAEVVGVCSEAAIIALTDDPQTQLLTQAHLEQAVARTNRQITPEMLQYYQRIHAASVPATKH